MTCPVKKYKNQFVNYTNLPCHKGVYKIYTLCRRDTLIKIKDYYSFFFRCLKSVFHQHKINVIFQKNEVIDLHTITINKQGNKILLTILYIYRDN